MFLLIGVLGLSIALPALAADPGVTKNIVTNEEGESVVVLTVSAAEKAVFGITVSDASASVEDIIAPDGWVGIATDDMVMFRTMEKPITSGKALTFRIVTTDTEAPLSVTFRDKKRNFGSTKDV
jgi:hypothetical protein